MIKAIVADPEFLDSRHIYSPDGTYLGQYNTARVLTKFEGQEIVDGPAPDHVLDRLVDGKLVKYVPPLTDEEKSAMVSTAVATLPKETLLGLSDFLVRGKLFMDAGRWDVVADIADSIQTADGNVRAVLKQVKQIAMGDPDVRVDPS